MGGGRKGSGVQLRPGKSVRVRFTYNGERCEESLDLRPTTANAKFAKAFVAEIKEKIQLGRFRYGDYFPESPRAGVADRPSGGDRSFGVFNDVYLKSIGRSAEATKSQYRNALVFFAKEIAKARDTVVDGGKDYAAAGFAIPLDSVTHAELVALIGSHEWASWRLCNNYLIPLRGVFALAARTLKFDNPMLGIKNMTRVKKLPDPLRWQEAEAIIEHMRNRYPEQVYNYFDFAFHTGMRPEEIIALRWADIDWFNDPPTIRVQRARTFRGTTKGVKTEAERDVDLNPRALAALQRQKAYTFMKDKEGGADIFENPVTGKPWHDERSQRDHYWNPTLRRLGIRYRRAYATRSTWATRLIMAGLKPAYIANQLGHTVMVLLTVYARWIEKADKGNEAAKVAALCSTEKSALEEPKK